MVLTADRDLSGCTLGRYRLHERIGAGGFGTVYRGEQPQLGRDVVVKVLHEQLQLDDDALRRFLREARLASRLDHPYAAHVYAFGVEDEDGLAWIAMELVQGVTLKRWLATHGPMTLEQFVFALVLKRVEGIWPLPPQLAGDVAAEAACRFSMAAASRGARFLSSAMPISFFRYSS